ncbi:MAG: 50S ribosomal protein L3 [Acidobacteriota bacterium]|nr:50S ribosomal protein L3 [Acidobacteriota bacterium]MDQ5873418.1 50S ribosomal protein L3 [Acidobacteriota bacterium]
MAVNGILGRKVGMTQIFTSDGTVVPVTVVAAGPCLVVQRKTTDKDGYDAIQIGLVESRPDRRANRARKGHADRAGVAPMRNIAEVESDGGDEVKPGDKVLCDTFKEQELVDVIGVSKGKGFAGVIRRHHFRGGAATHGSMFHRLPGSIGASAFPSRVMKGNRSSGRLGGKQATTKNLLVVRVDAEKNLIYLRGPVPGARRSLVKIVRATTAKSE